MQAFILRKALQTKTPAAWKLVAAVLPELRTVILRDALPKNVYHMLLDDLPKFRTAEYWDLNKRILICLSQLRQAAPDEQALQSLSLSDEEVKIVVYGAKKRGGEA